MKVINSNRMLLQDGKIVVVDKSGRKYSYFNIRSKPSRTEIFEQAQINHHTPIHREQTNRRSTPSQSVAFEQQRFKTTVICTVAIFGFIILFLAISLLQ